MLMPVPPEVQKLLDSTLADISGDPRHQLMPVRRLPIYQALQTASAPGTSDRVRGWLALLAARRVLPQWQRAMPLYEDDDPDERGVEANKLAEHFLTRAESVLRRTVDLNVARKEDGDYWYVVGNIEEEIFDWREETDGPLFYAFFALDAAYKALHEALGYEQLGRLKGWETRTDDTLPRFAGDAAASAVIAASGGGDVVAGPPIDPQKRLEFWEWWLTSAIPAAWEAGQNGRMAGRT
jgi:hypothetical protein